MQNLLYDPERRVAVEWDRAAADEQERYEVQLAVEVEDRPGLLATITKAIADTKADIRKVDARTFNDETASIGLSLHVADLRHLERIQKTVRQLKGVIAVQRQSR